MQTKKSQTLGQLIMPETRKTSSSALSIYSRIGIFLSASETDDRFYLSQRIAKVLPKVNSIVIRQKMTITVNYNDIHVTVVRYDRFPFYYYYCFIIIIIIIINIIRFL